jgi:hypothetical protein
MFLDESPLGPRESGVDRIADPLQPGTRVLEVLSLASVELILKGVRHAYTS